MEPRFFVVPRTMAKGKQIYILASVLLFHLSLFKGFHSFVHDFEQSQFNEGYRYRLGVHFHDPSLGEILDVEKLQQRFGWSVERIREGLFDKKLQNRRGKENFFELQFEIQKIRCRGSLESGVHSDTLLFSTSAKTNK